VGRTLLSAVFDLDVGDSNSRRLSGAMLCLRSMQRVTGMQMLRYVPIRARSFETIVPQDDSESRWQAG